MKVNVKRTDDCDGDDYRERAILDIDLKVINLKELTEDEKTRKSVFISQVWALAYATFGDAFRMRSEDVRSCALEEQELQQHG